jgi:hypothetical protein
MRHSIATFDPEFLGETGCAVLWTAARTDSGLTAIAKSAQAKCLCYQISFNAN